MKKRTSSKRTTTQQPQDSFEQSFPPLCQKRNTEPLTAKTPNQKKYIAALRTSPLTFGIGPAGCGKTYIAGAIAAQMLENKTVEKIIITRPAVEAGESLGFLPGELEEKYEPFIAPFRAVLDERLGKGATDYLFKTGRIVAAPLAYMRGATYKNAVVILDEAQNTTPRQMKLFLSRMGENCHVIVDGDPSQSDISGTSGLTDAVVRLSFIPTVKVVEFGHRDIVRSGLVQEIVMSYENPIPDLKLDRV
jgi:phosphate starvation-inducible PhoH-like protein